MKNVAYFAIAFTYLLVLCFGPPISITLVGCFTQLFWPKFYHVISLSLSEDLVWQRHRKVKRLWICVLFKLWWSSKCQRCHGWKGKKMLFFLELRECWVAFAICWFLCAGIVRPSSKDKLCHWQSSWWACGSPSPFIWRRSYQLTIINCYGGFSFFSQH